MSLFGKISGLLGGLISKLGPVASLIPMLLDLLQTKMNDEDAAGVEAVGAQFVDIGEKFSRIGQLMIDAVDENGPAGQDISGSEYQQFAGELLQLADELAELPGKIKDL